MGEWGCGIRDSERRRRDGSRLSPIPNPQPPMPDLKGKTLFITGASRGIGLAIALRAARDGANVAIAAKSDVPNPKLSGTLHTTTEAVNAAGGQGLALKCDIRGEDQETGREARRGRVCR